MKVVDEIITRIDAVMCGQQEGAVPLPEFDGVTLAKLRNAVQPLVIDCRLCKHVIDVTWGQKCDVACAAGDQFERAEFVPLWEVPS